MSEGTKWTAEPWEVVRLENGERMIRSLKGHGILRNIAWTNASEKGDLFDATNEASTRRIVSCVNACAGIADPEKAIPAMYEALEAVARLNEGQGRLNLCEVAGQARAALALAKGESDGND